jgi:tetratricopeptide (TPR) repeat protein
MKSKTILPAVFLLLFSLSAYADGSPVVAPIALEVTPAASFPLLDSGQQFAAGGMVEISGLYHLPVLPMAFLNAELGYGTLPLKVSGAVSLLSAGAGLGLELGLSPWLSLKLRGSGGVYWGYLADSTPQSGSANPYLYGGAGLDFFMSQEIGVGIEVGYRNYIGVYQGLEAALGARLHMGGEGWAESVQPAPASVQPLFLEVTPVISIPLLDSGSEFENGGLVELSALYHIPAFPAAFMNAELGYGNLPLKVSTSLAVLSAGAGAGLELGLFPWLSVRVRGSGGYYWGYLTDSTVQSGAGNPYVYGGAGFNLAVSHDVGVSVEAGYRNYLGAYQGLEASLGARVQMGGEGWAERVQPAEAGVQPLSLEITPAALVPLLDSGQEFAAGSLVELTGVFHLPVLPFAFFNAELGYGNLPLKATPSVSLLSGGAGLGVDLALAPWLSFQVRGSGGYYWGYLTDSSIQKGAGNPYLYGGAGLRFAMSPGVAAGVEVGYRNYLGVYQGLEAALTTRVDLGGAALTSTGGTPVERQPLPQKPSPLEGQPQQARPGMGVQVSNISLADIYPVFYKFYDDHPIGTAKLHNVEKVPVQSVRVSVFVKEFMDDPKEVKGPDTLAPGAEASIDLYGLLKKNVLENTEDTKVSAKITLQYSLNGKTLVSDSVQTVKVLKRNSLTWDDDKKAAAFASPNDPTAVKFAKNVAAIVNGKGNQAVEQNLRLAAAIHDALTLYGLTYTSDPVATLNSDNKTVDYIQFPQQTLDYRSGKCSDFSALYAAMFEAVGIETAFITIPGHIYMAFALTMSPDEARAAFTHKDDLIIVNDKVWVPIEITLREGGFVKAWQYGAKEWRENLAKKQAVLYPLHEAWKTYEPVGYSSGASDIKIPAESKIVLAFSNDLDTFVKGEIGQQEVALTAAVSKANTTPEKSKALNRLAVLHSRFGLYDLARKELQQILAKDEYAAALINMGNIYFREGNDDKALEYYNRAAAKDPKNPIVLLSLARANHALENYSLAKKAYAALQVADPNLASRFAYLDLRGEEATRAADASGAKAVVIWQDQ